jgi:hypothetical protein
MSRLRLRLLIYVSVVIASFFVSLDLLEYFDASTGTNCAAGGSCCPNGQMLIVSPPLSPLEGYAYKVSIPQLSSFGDTAEWATRSPAVMCEDDHQIGPGHAPFLEIVQKGAGRFSHYNDMVVFSSSDNTDPNSNGRRYKIVIPSARCRGLAFLLALC